MQNEILSLELISPVSFYFDVATRKFKYVNYFIFLLDSIFLDHSSIPPQHFLNLFHFGLTINLTI